MLSFFSECSTLGAIFEVNRRPQRDYQSPRPQPQNVLSATRAANRDIRSMKWWLTDGSLGETIDRDDECIPLIPKLPPFFF